MGRIENLLLVERLVEHPHKLQMYTQEISDITVKLNVFSGFWYRWLKILNSY